MNPYDIDIPTLINLLKTAYKNAVANKYAVSEKGQSDFVTSADIAIEKELKTKLSSILPDVGFICEETGNEVKKYNWVIDPIDGTTNFIHGLTHTISIALTCGKKSFLGMVYDPLNDIVYYAGKDDGAYKLQNSSITKLDASNIAEKKDVFCFGFPYDKTKVPKILKYVDNVILNAADVKRMGPASKDICLVAEGKLNGYFELDLKFWDYAAASLILTEAGGIYKVVDDLFISSNSAQFKYLQNQIMRI